MAASNSYHGYTAQGPAIQEFDLDSQLINIGSHADNDLVLADSGIMPFHCAIQNREGTFELFPLAADALVRLEGKLLDGPALLASEQQVEIGGISMFIRSGRVPESTHITVFKSGQALVAQPAMDGEDARSILVNIIKQAADVEVTQTAEYEFEIVNAGRIVAGFQLSIAGVPAEWVQVTPRVVNLNEGQRALVRAGITPPRSPESVAGKHKINVVVTSPNYPGQRNLTEVDLNIAPYTDFIVGTINPRQKNISWKEHRGRVLLPVTNQGNSAATFNVMAVDEENACAFDFILSEDQRLTRQASFPVERGSTIQLTVEITPNRQPVVAIRSRRYHYTASLQVIGQAAAPQTVSGSVVHSPLLGFWAILLTALLVLGGLFALVQPRINSFKVAAGKDVIEIGDTTNLEWSVSPFASRLSISNVEKEITRGTDHIAVTPSQSTTYEMVAGNWLSGLLGMDRKARVTVLVIPPSPQIAVFDVDQTSVDKGIPVNIRWSIAKADTAFLTIDELIYELKPENFNGTQSIILDRDAIVTLEAKNLSGSTMRSFFVQVVPPQITINKFIVWVRTETGSIMDTNRAAAQANILRVGDIRPLSYRQETLTAGTDFPYKFVELIPDETSDTGYRVKFYMPDRELGKGEQVMVEWDIEGVDNLTIAPFVETLPPKGSQPFFPQESMNFVMTAKSGELEKLFMLPVNVFNGEPPTAPTIDFFKAVPTKLIGSGPVQFSWSVSKAWTHIQLARGTDKGEEVVADWINPQGFKTVTVMKSATYLLKAWNGELSTASPVDVTVDPALIKVGLGIKSVFSESSNFILGQKVTVTIEFVDIPADKPKPSGTVTVTDGYSTCQMNLPAVSCDLVFTTPGDKKITASYSGDSIYLQADSAAYPVAEDEFIHVKNTQVSLVPKYFYYATGETILDLADPDLKLSMDDGLRLMVEVRPTSLSIPDDGKSHINVSICDQDPATHLIIKTSCSFLASATAEKYTTQTPVYGREEGRYYANIVIPRFTVSGIHSLLFEYYHDTNAVEPTSYTQGDVNIGRMQFHLGAKICTDVDALTGCELGAANPLDATLTFNFRTVSPFTDVDFTLPTPSAASFELSSSSSVSGAPTPEWSCKVDVASGVYVLVCNVKNMDPQYNPWKVKYSFNNNLDTSYYLQNDNSSIESVEFDLNVKANTKFIFEESNNVRVGQIVDITGPSGLVSLVNTQGDPLDAVSITLEDAGGKSLSAFACNDAINCSQDSSTGVITIPNVKTVSQVYFKRSGNIEIKAIFAPSSGTYLGSTGSETYTILKQDSISAVWTDQNGNALSTYLTVNAQMQIRVTLDITPAGTNDGALDGRALVISILGSEAQSNCKVGAAGTDTAGEYQVIIDEASGKLIADFTIGCGSQNTTLPYTADLQITFKNIGEDLTGDDLALLTSTTTSKQVTIQQNSNITLATTIKRMPTSTASHTNMVGATTIETFHVGEKYWVQFKVGDLWGYWNSWNAQYSSSLQVINDYLNSSNYVVISLPDVMEEAIDWTQSTCGTQYNVKVKLNRNVVPPTTYSYSDRSWDWGGAHWNYYFWGWVSFQLYNDPCYFVFKEPAAATGLNTTFSYTSHNNAYTASKTYGMNGVAKQTVVMTFNPAGTSGSPFSGYVDVPQVVQINLASGTNTDTTLPPIESSVTNFDTQLSATSTCGTLTEKKINGTSQAQFTLTSTSACSAKAVTVSYVQNSYYNALLNQSFNFSILKHTSASSIQYFNSSSQWVAFPFNENSTQMDKATDYKFRIQVAEGDSPAHTISAPTGTVRVKAGGGTYTIKDSSNALVTANADGYYHLTLDGSSTAVFTINFTDAVTTGIALQYDYLGSETYAASASPLQTSTFKVK